MRTCPLCQTCKPLAAFTPKNQRCKECRAQAARSRRIENNAHVNSVRKKWRAREVNLRMDRGYTAVWRAINKERLAIYAREWKERNREHVRKYDRANKAYVNSKTNRRRAQKLRATPAWANHFFMQEAYRLADMRSRMLGYRWEVDHIVPLRSETVCGLHVHNNLRVVPASENRSKGNRYWPDMP